MPQIDKALIEFKGSMLPVITVSLRSLQMQALNAATSALFGEEGFFDGDAALLELSQLPDEHEADWPQIARLFATHGLQVIGVRGGSDELRRHAAVAGLHSFALIERAPRRSPASAAAPPEIQPPEPPSPEPPSPEVQPPVQLAIDPALPIASAPTLVINRPLRSGQQVYARGGDLVILAAVNAGAEVIADGSIHIYAPLRGRALAGASGAGSARIFTTRFEAELVSIAGVYRTFETGVPGNLAGKPVQVQLVEVPANPPGEITSTLTIESLQTS